MVGDGLAACSRRKIALRVAGCMAGLRLRGSFARAEQRRPLRFARETQRAALLSARKQAVEA